VCSGGVCSGGLYVAGGVCVVVVCGGGFGGCVCL